MPEKCGHAGCEQCNGTGRRQLKTWWIQYSHRGKQYRETARTYSRKVAVTNEYNFEKLENPPRYAPTLCSQCGTIIRLGKESYAMSKDGYFCGRCRPVNL